MHRKFIALVVSAALAVTSVTAQPAQAGDDDTAKWIAGLAALAIIGAGIADHNNDRSRQYYHNGQGHTGKPYHGHGYNGRSRGGDHVIHPRPRKHFFLPAQCRVQRPLHGKTVRGFNRHCLKRNNVKVKALPSACAMKVRNRKNDRREVIYTGKCLSKYGYRIARR